MAVFAKKMANEKVFGYESKENGHFGRLNHGYFKKVGLKLDTYSLYPAMYFVVWLL